MSHSSLQQQLYLAVSLIVVLVTLLVAVLLTIVSPDQQYYAYWLSGVVVIAVLVGLLLTRLATKRMAYMLNALETGLLNFKDNDFSISLPADHHDELGRLAVLYNQVGEVLRKERQSIYQRELLLDKVIQSSPLSMVLTDENQRVLYSNIAARHLFNQGKRFEGSNFHQLIDSAPQSLSQAIKSAKDGLFSLSDPQNQSEEQTYHLSQSLFLLNARHHHLYLFKQLTKELNRQEVAVWKKVIRVISHELNNSLAPMSSMAHSGKILAKDDKKLNLIFNTIEERVSHLNGFIQGYAKFSRLPLPQRKNVIWADYIDGLKQQAPFSIKGKVPTGSGFFDPAQMEQVLINLIKNAAESGSAEDKIQLNLSEHPIAYQLTLTDRGSGMSDQVLQSALLPFYSTKQTGTGLGLPLCREIIEAHEGKIALSNREGGGLKVSVWLPR
ncbi:MAG: two-component system nitrogen regulation sensor histidine kinase NtrY [Alteromonadaceae bacterium]|jgi:two-component system nitrogen regulation sensor histidine kinase NtrY